MYTVDPNVGSRFQNELSCKRIAPDFQGGPTQPGEWITVVFGQLKHPLLPIEPFGSVQWLSLPLLQFWIAGQEFESFVGPVNGSPADDRPPFEPLRAGCCLSSLNGSMPHSSTHQPAGLAHN